MNSLGHGYKEERRSAFPKPDRSAFSPNLTEEDEDREFDISWAEGEWNDGRPYRAELWSWKSLSVITFFFSTIGLEDAGEPELARLLEKQSLVKFLGTRRIYAERVQDLAGNEMWSVSIPVREGNKKLVDLGFRLNSYPPSLDGRNIPPSEFSRKRIFVRKTHKLGVF